MPTSFLPSSMPILHRSIYSYHFFIDLHLKNLSQMACISVISHSEVHSCWSVPLGLNIQKTPAFSSRTRIHFIPLVGSGSNRFPSCVNHSRNNQLFMTCKTMQYVNSFDCDSVPDNICKLSILFNRTSGTPHGCWIQLGTALRMAQEVGAHRRRPLKAPTAENEHWKRAFWLFPFVLSTSPF